MNAGTDGLVAVVAGCAVALLLAWLAALLRRLLRATLALLRLPRRRGAVLWARLRGLRLHRSRALAQAEAARADTAAAELRLVRAELRLVRAERDEALARLAAVAEQGARPWPWRRALPPDERFLRAKRAFALRFHPDRLSRDLPDRPLRVAVFREHWQELQRIERGRG